jgi:hypothetical protein
MDRASRRVFGIVGMIVLFFVWGAGAQFYDDFIKPALVKSTPTARVVLARPTSIPTNAPTGTPAIPPMTCLHWSEITPQMEGDRACIYGVISSVHANYQAGQSFIYFGTEDQFFITNTFKWEGLEGQCTKARGIIGINTYGVPYIESDLYDCD